MSISISKTVRGYPKLPYQEMQEDILGKRYELSLVFVGEKRALTLNQKYRKKSYIPNVLSFPLDTMHGEIYIAPQVAKREAAHREMSVRGYVGFLFIHGLLHLKGHAHGATMEKAEKRYLAKYGLQ